jgi:hypothetical protein
MARKSTGRPLKIGPKTSQWFTAVGITTVEDLKAAGLIHVYKKVRNAGFPVSLNLLWALEGILQDRPWFSFTPEEKEQLKQELDHSETKKLKRKT